MLVQFLFLKCSFRPDEKQIKNLEEIITAAKGAEESLLKKKKISKKLENDCEIIKNELEKVRKEKEKILKRLYERMPREESWSGDSKLQFIETDTSEVDSTINNK